MEGKDNKECGVRLFLRSLAFAVLLMIAMPQEVSSHGEDSDGDGMPDSWEQRHGLSVLVQDALLDSDSDGSPNIHEYISGTDPTNEYSTFYLVVEANSNGATRTIHFPTGSDRLYTVQYSEDLSGTNWYAVSYDISGHDTWMQVDDYEAATTRFYRVVARIPGIDVLPVAHSFGPVTVGGTSTVQTITLINDDHVDHTLMKLELFDTGNGALRLLTPMPSNLLLEAGQSYAFDVEYAPTSSVALEASIKAHFDMHAFHIYIPVRGAGEYSYRVNAGGTNYVDGDGHLWVPDTGFYNDGNVHTETNPIANTTSDAIYQSERWDSADAPEIIYSFPVEPGPYVVRLHFAEIYSGNAAVGDRVFDVRVEGVTVLTNYDIMADVGFEAAAVKEYFTEVNDTSLDVEFIHKIENPKIAGIEVRSGSLFSEMSDVIWGHIELGQTNVVSFDLVNRSSNALTIEDLGFLVSGGEGTDFTVTLNGFTYTGAVSDVAYDLDYALAAGKRVEVEVAFQPSAELDNDVWLTFKGAFPAVNVRLRGTGGEGTGHPFLHVVIRGQELFVDYDGDGSALVTLDGSDSHTHEFGHELASFEWASNNVVLATNELFEEMYPVGSHAIDLTIYDDNEPPETLSDSFGFTVAPGDSVPGMLALYYEGVEGSGESSPEAMMDAVPPNADYAERAKTFDIVGGARGYGSTPYTGAVMAVMHGMLEVPSADTFSFALAGGVTNRLYINGTPYAGPVSLTAGWHAVEARFAVYGVSNMPLEIAHASGGGAFTGVPPTRVAHDETDMLPVINTAPEEGLDIGGNDIMITGLGFFPEESVVVHWGTNALSGTNLTVTPETIQFVSPPAAGIIEVTVETSNGMSDSFQFTGSSSGPVPIQFAQTNVATVIVPSQAAWGPDGRLYVASVAGTITVLGFDDNYNVTNTTEITALSTNANNNILGIAFNPMDPPDPVRVYVAHSLLYANGGTCFEGFSPYSGQVSMLSGPDFTNVVPILENLPVSNHDHGINGLQFDNQGRLLVAVGGNSNAGVTNCNMGGLPESPLTAAILRADVQKTNFNGNVIYVESSGGAANMDQVYGGEVDVADGVDVEVHAPGFRNPFDLVFTTRGKLYSMDNGPNQGFGPAATSPTTHSPDPDENDTLNLVIGGGYYGHPNRNRGRYDSRQNVFYDNDDPSEPGVFLQGMRIFTPSANGIDEYRAQTFRGAMQGNLLIQKWNGPTYRVQLSTNGRQAVIVNQLPVTLEGLDVIHGPGGALVGIDYSDNAVLVAVPEDVGATTMTAYDIFPWRALSDGGVPFVIGGSGFGQLSNTVVEIGEKTATVSAVSSTRIRGFLPVENTPTADMLDVTVFSGGATSVLGNAFRYLLPPGTGTGVWKRAEDLPAALGEVAAGVVNGVLYVFGEGDPRTLGYDIASGTWLTNLAVRPYVGHHHTAEVFGGKLYVFGGFNTDGDKVQIYDPQTDSWSLGVDMPFWAGSPSSAVIGDGIYVAGGIHSSVTIDSNAVYYPSSNTWQTLAPMPAGRNHAAGASDGERFYIFGGRGNGSGGNGAVAVGYDDVQIYDPLTDTWETSFDVGSTIPALPQRRGGMGSAVYFAGELYVLGGETTYDGEGAVAGDVYDRVDAYDPVAKSWRLDARMPYPRHGIYPVVHDGRIYLPGGGQTAGNAQSVVLDFLER